MKKKWLLACFVVCSAAGCACVGTACAEFDVGLWPCLAIAIVGGMAIGAIPTVVLAALLAESNAADAAVNRQIIRAANESLPQ